LLATLRIQNLAIVSEVEFDLGPGLNVITGETGAGKSILVAALKLVLGARGSGDLVRAGCDDAAVEALFEVEPATRARLRDGPFGNLGEEIAVRRVIQATGRSRAYIDGHLATTQSLAALASELVDISSQHEHQRLTDVSTHLGFLDAYAALDADRTRVQELFRAAESASRALSEITTRARDRGEREVILRFQLDEIAKVDPKEGEEDELHTEHARLSHADQLAHSTSRAVVNLQGKDSAILGILGRVIGDLEAAARHDPELEPIARQLEAARVELADAADTLARYSQRVIVDPRRLGWLDERLRAYRALSRKYGPVEEIVALRARAESELSRLDALDEDIDMLASAREAAVAALAEACRVLSGRRRDAARQLSDAITAELAALGMGHARVDVDVGALDARPDAMVFDGARLSASGMDRVEMLIAPNPGEEPRPLRKVASGGELSRSLLAVKQVLARHGPVGLYVFDEVDTGVGGAISEVIGRKLWEVSRHHQVLCITHAPQIAAWADHHFYVRKQVREDRTHSEVVKLDDTGRLEEISRMLGGVTITAATRAAAAELLAVRERA